MEMKNDFFNLTRLRMLLGKELLENGRMMLMRLLLVAGIILVIFLAMVFLDWEYYSSPHIYMMNGESHADDRSRVTLAMLFAGGAYLFGTVSASFFGARLSTKEQRLESVMFPASTFEKFLVRWIVSVLFFVLAYPLVCYAIEIVSLALFSSVAGSGLWLRPINIIGYLLHVKAYVICPFLILQSLFMLGGILWHRHAYGKTFVSLALIVLICAVIVTVCLQNHEGAYYGYDYCRRWLIGSTIVIVPVSYALAYFRLREMDVEDHW